MFSKWTIIILVFLILLAVAYFTGKKSVHSEIKIDAAPEKVWEVLINTSEYASWNPVMKLLDGELKEGHNVQYEFTQGADNIYKISASVKKVITCKLLNQKGGMPLFLTFNHTYTIVPSSQGTKVIIHEDYRGIGVHFWNPEPVEEAYIKLNKALKKHTESVN